MPSSSFSPELVVQRQLDAYNAKDLPTLLGIYSDDAELFEHPSKLLAKGSEQLGERFALRFREPDLRAELLNRVVMGNVVIDHERVTRTFPEGRGNVEMIMIYEVDAGRIRKAWSIVGAKARGATV